MNIYRCKWNIRMYHHTYLVVYFFKIILTQHVVINISCCLFFKNYFNTICCDKLQHWHKMDCICYKKKQQKNSKLLLLIFVQLIWLLEHKLKHKAHIHHTHTQAQGSHLTAHAVHFHHLSACSFTVILTDSTSLEEVISYYKHATIVST